MHGPTLELSALGSPAPREQMRELELLRASRLKPIRWEFSGTKGLPARANTWSLSSLESAGTTGDSLLALQWSRHPMGVQLAPN